MRRGEIWLYEHPNKPRRPAVILTRDDHIDRQLDVIAIPITSNIRGWDTEIELDRSDGMDRDCVLTVHNTFLAKQGYLTKHISTLDSVRMSQICKMLAFATNC